MSRRTLTPLQRHEADVLARATYFVACRFRGRGRYDRVEAPTLAAARSAAWTLGSRTLIYAVAHPNHDRFRLHQQVLVEVAG